MIIIIFSKGDWQDYDYKITIKNCLLTKCPYCTINEKSTHCIVFQVATDTFLPFWTSKLFLSALFQRNKSLNLQNIIVIPEIHSSPIYTSPPAPGLMHSPHFFQHQHCSKSVLLHYSRISCSDHVSLERIGKFERWIPKALQQEFPPC